MLWAIRQRKLELSIRHLTLTVILKLFAMKAKRFLVRAQSSFKRTWAKLKPWYRFAAKAVQILIFVVLYFGAPMELLDRLDKITGIIDVIL
ncbi:MAG: hypothetical protein IPH16_18425 [Haliscomenobacter sp.]|nr:hypothetical protein [Haliscomenobacter sp.]